MKKYVYTEKQMQELVGLLDRLTINGVHNCKLIALSTQIIDSPENIIEEEEGEKQ